MAIGTFEVSKQAGFGLVESQNLLVIEAFERKTGIGLGWVKKLIRGIARA